MKIKLTRPIPVNPLNRCDVDRVFKVEKREAGALWIMGDLGELVKVLHYEYEIVED